jgi:hypothetical protein
MRRSVLYIFAVALCLVSCSENDEPQYTPQISVSHLIVWHEDAEQAHDTLKVYSTNDGYVTDTISVGDTVRFAVACDALTNQLKSLETQTDANVLAFTIFLTSQHNQALEATSDAEKGLLYFKPGYRYAAFEMQYVAQKSGSANVSFTVSTTSKFSPATLSFRQPVR